ncbi:hypothetical protein TCDM_12965 [Trypanosoma cruzi Dm28c]|uniref:Uncharacterized protein n=1 Tax=Trypanosoma cruzi Dm28c TaxID=1416333 RepID=V5CJN3_TRYCR|nr:hypothetical protein TCDM_12965 [Trypanosoma cruzi Dm28c]
MRPSTAAAAHRAHHTRRKSDSRCALPSPSLPSCPRKKAAATRNRQRTPQKKHQNPLQCALCACIWLCVPADTRGKEVKTGAEHVKGRTKKTVQ